MWRPRCFSFRLFSHMHPKLRHASFFVCSNKPFGYVYDGRMLEHDCPYDGTMAERPERMKLIYERLQKDGQLANAVKIAAREASDDELLLNHSRQLLQELKTLKTTEDCEEYCKNKEILWLGPKSEMAARVAAGSTIELVKANVQGKIGNGFAIVRPPGHHAHGRVPQGYCVFNNVVVAAKYAVENLGIRKVAIVDFDYHPGNGTFESVKGDSRLHLTSFHAYHHGAFWPWERTYDYDKSKQQLFFPLNGALNTEGDFCSAFVHVLLPILREWSPEMILISAGFDAAFCDIMLDMGQAVKAHGYGEMARQLSEICPERTLAVLEGGYFPHSYVESASQMVKGLQGSPLPRVQYPDRVRAPLRETILNNIVHHSKNWECMKDTLNKIQSQQEQLGLIPYTPGPRLFLGQGVRQHWEEVKSLKAVRTREWFPPLSAEISQKNIDTINKYVKEYEYVNDTTTPSSDSLLSQLVWDEEAVAGSYSLSAPSTMLFYQEFYDYLDGKIDHMMICDRQLYRQAKEKLNSAC